MRQAPALAWGLAALAVACGSADSGDLFGPREGNGGSGSFGDAGLRSGLAPDPNGGSSGTGGAAGAEEDAGELAPPLAPDAGSSDAGVTDAATVDAAP